jgi:hypothetical protein
MPQELSAVEIWMDSYDRSVERMTVLMRGWLRRNVGTKCRDYEPACSCCQAWRKYEEFLAVIDTRPKTPEK